MYIKFNENGEYGFYTPEIHGEEFCKNECIKIADEFYVFLLLNNGKYLIDVNIVTDTVSKENLIERPMSIAELTPEQEIQKLKEQLEQSDYMIVKCYEYQLIGKELPYNLEALHRDRQAMRDKINQLER